MVRAKSYQQAHRPAHPQCARRADRDSAVAEAIRHHRCEQSSVAAVAGARVVRARKDKARVPPFVPVDLEMMNSPAWRATSHGARWLYMHLKRRWSFKQKNNGRIFLSHLDAVKEMGGTPDSISRWFRELQHYGQCGALPLPSTPRQPGSVITMKPARSTARARSITPSNASARC